MRVAWQKPCYVTFAKHGEIWMSPYTPALYGADQTIQGKCSGTGRFMVGLAGPGFCSTGGTETGVKPGALSKDRSPPQPGEQPKQQRKEGRKV